MPRAGDAMGRHPGAGRAAQHACMRLVLTQPKLHRHYRACTSAEPFLVKATLHTWKSKPRNRLFRRALAMRAILWAARLPRASMAAQAAWQKHSPHRGECFRPSGSAQLQRTADLCCPQVSARAGLERRPAGAQDGRSLSSSAHARTTQDPVRVCHGSHLPAPVARTPINLFNSHRRR